MFKLTDEIKELINLTDLFLLDIKHINPDRSKELVRNFKRTRIRFCKIFE